MNKTTDELVAIILNGIGGQQKSMARWALHELAERAEREVQRETVLGDCRHGIDLDQAFCPHGCRV